MAGNGRRLTDEDRAMVHELWAQGLSISAIGRRLGMAKETARDELGPAYEPRSRQRLSLAEAETLRGMERDEYAWWMLEHGHYDVDVTTGVVTNARTGQPVKPRLTMDGYHTITLTYGRACQRNASVHRLVALKLWGLEAVRGHDVGHRHGRTTINTVDELWLPATRSEHSRYDGNHRQPKEAWDPCVLCGDPDGPIPRHALTPSRLNGTRFGIAGKLCRRCYGRLTQRERYRKQRGATVH